MKIDFPFSEGVTSQTNVLFVYKSRLSSDNIRRMLSKTQKDKLDQILGRNYCNLTNYFSFLEAVQHFCFKVCSGFLIFEKGRVRYYSRIG